MALEGAQLEALTQTLEGVAQAAETFAVASYNRKLNEFTLEAREHDANEIRSYGQTLSSRVQANVDRVIGSQQAILASQGVNVAYGSAAKVQQETRTVGVINALALQGAARNKAYGISSESVGLRLQGRLDYLKGKEQAFTQLRNALLSGRDTLNADAAKSNARAGNIDRAKDTLSKLGGARWRIESRGGGLYLL